MFPTPTNAPTPAKPGDSRENTGWQLRVWATVGATALSGLVGNAVHLLTREGGPITPGLSAKPVNPIDPKTPLQMGEVSWSSKKGQPVSPETSPPKAIQVNFKDDKLRNRQPHAPNFEALPLSAAGQEQIIKQFKISGLDHLLRDGRAEILRIHIHGLSSPEGTDPRSVEPGTTEEKNLKLAQRRAELCLDQHAGPALIGLGMSPESIRSKVSFSAEEVQFSQESYNALHTIAKNHKLDGGLKHDAVHRLIRAYNAGELQSLSQDEARILGGVLDDARGAIVTVTYKEIPKAPPSSPIAAQPPSNPLELSFLVPIPIPIFRRRQQSSSPQQDDSRTPPNSLPKPEPTPGAVPPSPLTPGPPQAPNTPDPSRPPSPPREDDSIPVVPRGPERRATIPLSPIPGRDPERAQLDLVEDLYTHLDVHPRVNYRHLLSESKRLEGENLIDDLSRRILASWGACDGVDYSTSASQRAWARGHAEILIALDAEEPRDRDLLEKVRAYADRVSPGLPASVDHDRAATPIAEVEGYKEIIHDTLTRDQALYEALLSRVHAELSPRASEASLKRQVEREIIALWERLDSCPYYHNKRQRHWAAAFAEELCKPNRAAP